MAEPIPTHIVHPLACWAPATGPVTQYELLLRTPACDCTYHTADTCLYLWPPAPAGQPFTIQARALDATGASGPWGEVSDTYVPEPSAGLLLIAGLVGLALIGRWRRG